MTNRTDVNEGSAGLRCSTAVDAYEMRRRRIMLAEFPTLRQQAIADFVLSTASAANDLREFVKHRQQGVKLSPEAVEAARYLEDVIRCRYRECFGCELGQ